jgi:hypothetical protein
MCEKYTHLSKLKEWTQRHVEYSESETLMMTLQGGCLPSRDTRSYYNKQYCNEPVMGVLVFAGLRNKLRRHR